jgi:hypothetical protein
MGVKVPGGDDPGGSCASARPASLASTSTSSDAREESNHHRIRHIAVWVLRPELFLAHGFKTRFETDSERSLNMTGIIDSGCRRRDVLADTA